jgi:acyl-coenzyme A thioesterase PaaI-like protein
VRFLAPCREAVVARSRIVKAGRTLVTGEVELRGLGTDKLFATCGMTYIRLDGQTTR